MSDHKTQSAIEAAVEIVGTQHKLAEMCGVTQSLISQWVNGASIHHRHFQSIEAATNGAVTLQRLLEEEIAKTKARSAVA